MQVLNFASVSRLPTNTSSLLLPGVTKLQVNLILIRECIPVGCAPSRRETPPWTETPWTEETPLDRDSPWTETPPGHVTCGACWYIDPPPMNRITDTRKSITLPQHRCGR